MTVTTIPVRATTDAFSAQVDLDGSVYELRFRWNARDSHWSLDMLLEGVFVLSGLKLIASDDLLFSVRALPGIPPGRLHTTDLDALDRDPNATLFGDRVELRYDDLDGE